MTLLELFIIAVGLSMDAFAVSVCKGLSLQKMRLRHALLAGIYFGGFQAMPFFGYLLGVKFQDAITSIDHWVAFILLAIIGVNMVKEALSKEEEEETDPSFGLKNMLILAVATSIDALAVGVTFAFLKVRILAAVCFIGVTTFILSMAGVKVGNVFGSRYKAKAELAGGVILIGMGVKILLEHTVLG